MASKQDIRPPRPVEARPEPKEVVISKDPEQQDIPQKKIIKGKVIRRKKSFLQKFSETFLGDTLGSVGEYIVHDVLIPAAKSMISDALTGGIDMALFGEKKSTRTRRAGGSSVVSYSNYYNDKDRGRRDDRDRSSRGKRADDLIFERRSSAVEVLDSLVELLDKYEEVSVADLYDIMGIVSKDHTDQNYGWTNLARARVEPCRGGFLLDLPKSIELE